MVVPVHVNVDVPKEENVLAPNLLPESVVVMIHVLVDVFKVANVHVRNQVPLLAIA